MEEVVIGDTVVIKPGMRIRWTARCWRECPAWTRRHYRREHPGGKRARRPGDRRGDQQGGSFTFKAEKVGQDTTLAQIIALVQDASATKAPIAKLADKVSGVFMPVVMVIAAAAFLVWLLLGQTLEFALAGAIAVGHQLPLRAGPCHPGGDHGGHRQRAQSWASVYKNAEALENAHKVDTIVLDKTGTITEGRPVLTDLIPLAGQTGSRAACPGGGAGKAQRTPSGRSHSGRGGGDEPLPRGAVRGAAGPGPESNPFGQDLLCEQCRLMEEKGIHWKGWAKCPHTLANQGKTPLYFGSGRTLLKVVAPADPVKPTSGGGTIKTCRVWAQWSTGDNARTAATIQRQLGIGQVVAEVRPGPGPGARVQGGEGGNGGRQHQRRPGACRADIGIAIGAGTRRSH